MNQPIPYDPSMPDRQEIEAFHRMTDEERFLEGPRLFDMACRIALDGIRHDYPDASEEEHHRILRERVDLMRRLEGDVDE